MMYLCHLKKYREVAELFSDLFALSVKQGHCLITFDVILILRIVYKCFRDFYRTSLTYKMCIHIMI